jgi:Fe-S cluster biosynthesis and repair protein YggX
MARTVNCIKLGREAEGLDFPPYPGELGKRLYESVSKEAWAQWQRHQTMLINENRLNLADPKARKYLAEQMEKHFFGEGADQASGYVPPRG